MRPWGKRGRGCRHVVNADQLFFLSSSQSHLLGDRGPGPVARLQLVVAAPGLSPDTLEERWAAAAGRHDVLRLTFVEKPGLTTFLQGLDDEPAPLTVGAPGQDTRAVADAEWEAALELTRGGLVRAALTDTDLVVTAAAAVADARTLSLLADELLTGRPAAAEPLPFLDFASWERDHLEEDSAEARVGRAYWRGVVDSPAPVASTVATPLRSVELRNLPGAGPDTWLTALALATRATRSTRTTRTARSSPSRCPVAPMTSWTWPWGPTSGTYRWPRRASSRPPRRRRRPTGAARGR